MTWCLTIAGLLATLGSSPSAVARVEQVKVTARIMRGAEASTRRKSRHQPNRIRKVYEKAPQGGSVELIIFEFE